MLRDKINREVGEMFATHADMSWFDAEKFTESPIETGFAVAMEWQGRYHLEDVFISKRPETEANFFSDLNKAFGRLCWTHIHPQAQIGNHRVDFLITFRCGDGEEALIVECDGHDFHDRTTFQASRDRERDRSLVSNGHRVFRFTGTDINRRPLECAYEVMMFILTQRSAAGRRQEEAGE